MMKFTHTKGFNAMCLGLVMAFIIIALTLATIHAGMACTNGDGCAKRWCKLDKLKDDAKALIEGKSGTCGPTRNPPQISS